MRLQADLQADAAGPGEEVYDAGVVLVQVSEQLVHALRRRIIEQLCVHLSMQQSRCHHPEVHQPKSHPGPLCFAPNFRDHPPCNERNQALWHAILSSDGVKPQLVSVEGLWCSEEQEQQSHRLKLFMGHDIVLVEVELAEHVADGHQTR